jgi:hypothetical protein
MCWRCVDERLIRRGELLLSLDFLESYDLELSVLNFGKVGRPYRVTYMYVVFLAVVGYLIGMPYRQGSLRVSLGPYTDSYLNYHR